MNSEQIIQTTFLVPIREDKDVGNGELHPHYKWEWVTKELEIRFGGWTITPNFFAGGWVNPETGELEEDESRMYIVDVKRKDLNKMREFIKEIASMFRQKCIRFEHKGKVEYI